LHGGELKRSIRRSRLEPVLQLLPFSKESLAIRRQMPGAKAPTADGGWVTDKAKASKMTHSAKDPGNLRAFNKPRRLPMRGFWMMAAF
jgi:hypothetical protein